jgi:NNP family nitrate/nitrite transporter-like MFS transporter
MGFATFGVLAVFAFGFLLALRMQWLRWAAPGAVAAGHGSATALVHATE